MFIGVDLSGYNTYDGCLLPFDETLQLKHTAIFEPKHRALIPEFDAFCTYIEGKLAEEFFGLGVEVDAVKMSPLELNKNHHALRQWWETHRASSFGEHQDTEAEVDKPNVITVCCKLNDDDPAMLPSSMRVVGKEPFVYGTRAGSAAVFISGAYHESIEPTKDAARQLKIAIFLKFKAAPLALPTLLALQHPYPCPA